MDSSYFAQDEDTGDPVRIPCVTLMFDVVVAILLLGICDRL